MYRIFSNSYFDEDISLWDVSNVTFMTNMFYLAEFNGKISHWYISNITNKSSIYEEINHNNFYY